MGLFSKEECCFCNKKVGMLSRKKLRDKTVSYTHLHIGGALLWVIISQID